uniref:Selenoprotein O n=1 Tax=Hucho hucho TaxID=62062 RepID=A0A4W5NPE1_9TELE
FSRVQPQPLINPTFVAVSGPALALLGLDEEEIFHDPLGPEYSSGSKVLPGSEPAAHCYCGHQFGLFAGQLGDGAVCYLGERDNPCGRWEIQLKGAGSDGGKVLRSSIQEFLCSEAMAALGIPTTRAIGPLCQQRPPQQWPVPPREVFGGPAHRPLLHQVNGTSASLPLSTGTSRCPIDIKSYSFRNLYHEGCA